MASRFRTRLKRVCNSLQALLRLNQPLKNTHGSKTNPQLSSKDSNDGDSTDSEVVSRVTRTDVKSVIHSDSPVTTNTPESFLTWLTYTTGDPTPWKTPSLSEEHPKSPHEDATLTALDSTESQDPWPFLEFPIANDPKLEVHRLPPPQPTFHPFMRLPYELRMKIFRLTITPRIVHYNGFGAHGSRIRINDKVPRMMQICQESRAEALRIYRLSPGVDVEKIEKRVNLKLGGQGNLRLGDLLGNSTFPIRFCGEEDLLLWTRYWPVKKTFENDAKRLLRPETLQHVRKFAILIDYWNRITSDPEYREMYAAIRRAPNLKMLCLVSEDVPRRRRVYKKQMKVKCWDGPEYVCRQLVRWEKEVRSQGKDAVWKSWDKKLLEDAERKRVTRGYPDIRFAKVVLDAYSKRKPKGPVLEEW